MCVFFKVGSGSLRGFWGVPSKMGNNLFSLLFHPDVTPNDGMYDYFGHGFNTLSVIKHLKVKVIWEGGGPGRKFNQIWVCGLICFSLGVFDMKNFGNYCIKHTNLERLKKIELNLCLSDSVNKTEHHKLHRVRIYERAVGLSLLNL